MIFIFIFEESPFVSHKRSNVYISVKSEWRYINTDGELVPSDYVVCVNVRKWDEAVGGLLDNSCSSEVGVLSPPGRRQKVSKRGPPPPPFLGAKYG